MSEGGQAQRRGAAREQEPDEQVEAHEHDDAQAGAKDLLDDVDELLDEIDDVLEENAEEFVRGYVQKGGQ